MSFSESVLQLKNKKTTDRVENMDFPEYRGLTFKEFWEKLPGNLKYFDYEEELEADLRETKHLWVKKSAGLGITEFTVRWIAWNCVKDDVWKNQQIDVNVAIVVGPRIDLAITIMGRIKRLFGEGNFKTKETVMILNGNKIEVFPSYHLGSLHGINPKVVFLDEGDLFPPGQQIRARQASERYIPKTNPYIIWVSTPYLPGGLYEQIEHEDPCMYRRKIMLVDRGIDKVYSEEDLAIAKLSPTYEMEYCGKYGYGVGDIFEGIDDIIEDYDQKRIGGRACVTADPAFGNSDVASKFGLCAGEMRDEIAYVLEAKEYARSSPSVMLDILENFSHNYDNNVKIDAAHPGFIRDLLSRGVSVRPVNFGMPVKEKEGDTGKQSLRSKMTINAAQMVKNQLVRIHPKQTALIAQLRAAHFDDKGGVDKTELNFDIGDAFLMLCWEMAMGRSTVRKLKGSF